MKQQFLHNSILTVLCAVIAFICCIFGMRTAKAYAATPLVDGTSTGPIANGTITWNHTVTSNNNGLLIVYIQNNGQRISSVTYNGKTMTSGNPLNQSTVGFIDFYTFIPDTGTHPIVVNGSGALMAGAISLTNVNQKSPWDSSNYMGKCPASTAIWCYDSISPTSATTFFMQWTAVDDPDNLTFTPMNTATQIGSTLHSGSKYFVTEYFPGINGMMTPSWSVSPNPQNNFRDAEQVYLGIQPAPITPTPIPTATPVPTETPTPTPTPKLYTISGSVFNDGDNNGVQNSGEANYTGTPAIAASRGTVTVTPNGTYIISNLVAGTVTVSYTALPSGYRMTSPLNGPPPSFQVTVGPGCSTNSAPGASCQ